MVETPHTTSDAPIKKSRFGISNVSAEAAEALMRRMSPTTHPSPRGRLPAINLIMYVSIDFEPCC
jgi:hypothetical protein